MTKKKRLPDPVFRDLSLTGENRVKEAVQTVLQLIDDPAQRAAMLIIMATGLAHDAAHTLDDAIEIDEKEHNSLALSWAEVIRNIASGMCPEIRKAVKQEMKNGRGRAGR